MLFGFSRRILQLCKNVFLLRLFPLPYARNFLFLCLRKPLSVYPKSIGNCWNIRMARTGYRRIWHPRYFFMQFYIYWLWCRAIPKSKSCSSFSRLTWHCTQKISSVLVTLIFFLGWVMNFELLVHGDGLNMHWFVKFNQDWLCIFCNSNRMHNVHSNSRAFRKGRK